LFAFFLIQQAILPRHHRPFTRFNFIPILTFKMRFPIDVVARAAAISAAHSPRAPITNSSVSRLLTAGVGKVFVLDFDGSAFTTSVNATITGDPSWVSYVAPNRLYAVNEWENDMRVLDFDINAGTLEPLNSSLASWGAVDIEFSADGTRMLTASYTNGTVDVWNVEDDTTLTFIKNITSTEQTGPDESQTQPRMHQSVLDPSGRFFAVNDLGTDTIHVIDSEADAFDVVNTVRVSPAGCGPRHGVFYPPSTTGERATHYFVVCELANLVVSYALDYESTPGSLAFAHIGDISTFDPANPPVNATVTAAAGEIVLSQDGHDLYVSNRLTGEDTDSIAHFSVERATGALTLQGLVSSGGQLPRMFSISNDGQELFIANQDGPLGVVALRRNCDGSLDEEPLASIPIEVFGAADTFAGPKYIQQIA
jgi:6-phosphogluconolactonase (cycloisomerase 2 family)